MQTSCTGGKEDALVSPAARIARRPVLAYYVVTFATSWGALLLVVGGPGALPGRPEQIARLMPLAVLALIAGPGLAGVAVTAAVSGAAGLRELGARLVRWRVDARWYAVALLVAPLTTIAILLVLSSRSAALVPPLVTSAHRGPLLLLALGTLLVGGLPEELGWTGFAIPRLRRRHGALATGIIIGVLWGAWHFPMNVWVSGALAGSLPPVLFVPPYLCAGVAQLTAYRVLMVWVYERTGSLLVATLMHGSLIASTAIPVLAPPATGIGFLAWFAASGAALWIVAGAVAAGTLTRRDPG